MENLSLFMLVFALMHGIFSILYLVSKERRGHHDFIAVFWILIIVLTMSRRAFQVSSGHWDVWFIRMVGYPLAQGPCLYLYTTFLTVSDRKFELKDLLHFVPFVLASALTAGWGHAYATTLIDQAPDAHRSPEHIVMGVASTASVLVYAVLSIRRVQQHRERLPDHVSTITLANSLLWLNVVCWILLGFLLTLTALQIVAQAQLAPQPWVVSTAFIFYLMLISFFCLRQSPVYAEGEPSENNPEKTGEIKPQSRYMRSSLGEEKLSVLQARLMEHMEKDKPYLNDDLNLNSLAARLDISANHLSQVLNAQIKKNFYNFVNEYRVKEAESRLKNPAYADYPISRIGLDCGFNSKSTFYGLFLKSMGMSPGEFRSKAQ